MQLCFRGAAHKSAGFVEVTLDDGTTGVGEAYMAVFAPRVFEAIVNLVAPYLVGIVNWTVNGWMPTFLKDQFHLGNGAAGLNATLYIQIASLGGVLTAGVLADQWSRTNPRARAIVPAVAWMMAGWCFTARRTRVGRSIP